MNKVLIWADEWYPVVGGLELALHRTALALVSEGITVTAVTVQDGHDRKSLGYLVEEFQRGSWLSQSGDWILQQISKGDVIYIARLFKKYERAQLKILSHCDTAIRILRVPSTWGIRRYDSEEYRELLTSAVDGFFALNDHTENIIRRRFPKKRISKIYNWSPMTVRSVETNRTGFVYAGRAVRSKNLINLLRAWRNYAADTNEILTIYTGDALDNTLREALSSAQTDPKFSIQRPYLPGDSSMLSKFKFVVLPSFREGCPNILVESYFQRTPVIGSDVPGIGEHVQAVGGVVIQPPLDADAIEAALRRAKKGSETEYLAIQEKIGVYFENNFSHEQAASEIIKVIEKQSSHKQ